VRDQPIGLLTIGVAAFAAAAVEMGF